MQHQRADLFVGLKITTKLKEQLDESGIGMKEFFNGNTKRFLQVLEIDEDEYLGKICASSCSLENLENVLNNVRSMLKMICPKYSIPEDAIKIQAISTSPWKTFYS